MKNLSFGVFAAAVVLISTNVTMGHAENYRICGMGKEAQCYSESEAKGKKHCGDKMKESLCRSSLSMVRSMT